MFCKYCGKKLDSNLSKCSNCGRLQDCMVSGNGFWDLCDKNVSKDISRDTFKNTSEDIVGDNIDREATERRKIKESEDDKNEKKQINIIYSIVFVFMMTICLASIVINFFLIREVKMISSELQQVVSELLLEKGEIDDINTNDNKNPIDETGENNNSIDDISPSNNDEKILPSSNDSK